MEKVTVLVLIYISVSWAKHQPTIETALGKVKGYHKLSFDGRTYSAFEGIPYAKPPVGDLRFEEPQPAAPWDGILNASTLYTCLQIGMDVTSVIGQEDCLYINIYVPKAQPLESDNFDVLVYIHGGAFMIGLGGMAGPSYLMDRNIIYVNFNYRLGILGFLSTEDAVVPGNNGLKDQQFALKWIQSYIKLTMLYKTGPKRFGGNPNSVTLIGMSAGAVSVHFHYFSEHSKGLFHRGISTSGTVLMPWALQEAALEKTKKLGVLTDCHYLQIRDVINCLKKVPGKELVGKTPNFFGILNLPLAPFAPVVEQPLKTAFLTKTPHQLLLGGEINDVPWLTSIAKDEGLAIGAIVERKLDEISENWDALMPILLDYNYTVAESNKKSVGDKITETYFDNIKLSSKNIESLIVLFGDRYFNVGFEKAIHMQAKVCKSPIYAYVYNHESEFRSVKMYESALKGVAHGDDALLMYDFKFEELSYANVSPSPSDVAMKDVLIDLLTSFAADGNPQLKGISWVPMSKEKFNYLYIPNAQKMEMFHTDELTQWKYWESLDIVDYNRGTAVKDEL